MAVELQREGWSGGTSPEAGVVVTFSERCAEIGASLVAVAVPD
jgi:hypothetical protein